MRSASWRRRITTLGLVTVAAVLVTACSSTNSATSATTSGSSAGSSSIPQSAFSDRTGITGTTVHVANVSTLSGGLFKGAAVGTQAYADDVNSTGGVKGRTIVVDSGDDLFQGATNTQLTQSALTNDFALVGGFSLEDQFGGVVLSRNPGMPDVTVSLDQKTLHLSNVFSPAPATGGWQEGSLQYFKKKFPQDITAVGSLVADEPSAESDWAGEKYVMQQLGYKVLYDQTFAITQTDFTQNVIAMRNAGVKMLFIEQMPANYASGVLKALQQQNFHPTVILGASTYSNQLVSDSGGASAVNGSYLDQNASLYLGGDSSAIPAVGTFLHWVQVASPGFQPDLFTLYGWMSAELFAQGLQNAGSSPSRGSLLQSLQKITTFSGNNIQAPANPVAKTLSNCYLIGQVVNGEFQRLDDPPVNSSTNGYRCDYQYVTPPKS